MTVRSVAIARAGAHASQESPHRDLVGEDVGRRVADVARSGPQLGGGSGPQHPGKRPRGCNAHANRDTADLRPAHLQIAGTALVVRGVEDQVDAVVVQVRERPARQPGEDALSLVVGMGGGVHGADGSQGRTVGSAESPAEEHPEPGEISVLGLRHPGRGPAKGILVVLPREERLVGIVGCPTERGPTQLDDAITVVAVRPPDRQPPASSAPTVMPSRYLGGPPGSILFTVKLYDAVRVGPTPMPTRRSIMKIVVTGGAGFIGANLCRRLADHPAVSHVQALDDLSTGFRSNLDGVDAELVEGSILDTELVDKCAADAAAIVHLGARPSVPRSVTDPVASHLANATGTVNVLEAARNAGGIRVVVASSSSVYGANPTLPKHEDLATRPLSPYAASKLATEAYALAWQQTYDMPVLALRFFNVFGPLQAAGHAYAAVIPAFVDAALPGRTPPGPRRRHPGSRLHLRRHRHRGSGRCRRRWRRPSDAGQPRLRHPHRSAPPHGAPRGDPGTAARASTISRPGWAT